MARPKNKPVRGSIYRERVILYMWELNECLLHVSFAGTAIYSLLFLKLCTCLIVKCIGGFSWNSPDYKDSIPVCETDRKATKVDFSDYSKQIKVLAYMDELLEANFLY